MKKSAVTAVIALGILLAALAALLLAPVSCYKVSSPRSLPSFSKNYALANINTAASKELEAAPGIGPLTAARIIRYREKHGPFEKMEDLGAVEGLTPALLEKLKAGFKTE